MLVRKNVKLIHSAGDVPIIIGDTGRIVQILYNLVGNAGGWRCHATSVIYSPRGTTGWKRASAQTKQNFLALALKGAHGCELEACPALLLLVWSRACTRNAVQLSCAMTLTTKSHAERYLLAVRISCPVPPAILAIPCPASALFLTCPLHPLTPPTPLLLNLSSPVSPPHDLMSVQPSSQSRAPSLSPLVSVGTASGCSSRWQTQAVECPRTRSARSLGRLNRCVEKGAQYTLVCICWVCAMRGLGVLEEVQYGTAAASWLVAVKLLPLHSAPAGQ